MTVQNELTGFLAAGRHTHPVNGVVKTALEEDQQVLTGDAFLLLGELVVQTELFLQQTVVTSDLLFFTQLHPVFADLLAGGAVLTGSGAPHFKRALAGNASVAFQEELAALSAALFATGSRISCHIRILPFD